MSGTILWEKEIRDGVWLRLVQGDITEERVDAVVNAANSALAHGGGVAGAIVRKGGDEIQRESDRVAPVPVGGAAMTGAGRLPARAVIHAVGPRMGEGDEDAKLSSAVRSALRLACEKGFGSISMPAIGSGIFGYPKDRCAEALLSTTLEFLKENPETTLREVRFCNFDEPTCSIFLAHFRSVEWPPGS
ncbi:macro domain-containing protein [Candidatus Sumerlaeota bacterium]|nr:macro domain-containing protein [Candidatus Sumerlaeota bacterium]